MDTDRDAQTLHDWMGTQRWFAGKGRQWRVTGVEQLVELRGEPAPVRLLVVWAEFSNGDIEAYQLALSLRPEPNEMIGHVLIGEMEQGGRRYYAYDAFHDKEATAILLEHLRAGGTVGNVEFHPLDGGLAVPVDEPSHVLGGEQSNTSIVFGRMAILKAFRKLAPGLNPDIEIHEALAGVGCEEIARPLGHVAARWTDTDGQQVKGSLGMMQEFLAGASVGWDLAQASVRDLFAEGDLHADEVGGDFAGESFRLGEATAKVHASLAEALPTKVLSDAERRGIAAAMQSRLVSAAEQVPELRPHVQALSEKYTLLAERSEPVVVQRIHGDYHLGQVMRTAYGWRLLDFEGEPAKGLDERREPDSVIRDVAGMLRSFDYAARFQIVDRGREPQREYRADEWAERNRSAFCDGYASAVGKDPRDEGDLICAYEADKAVYELLYEARNRPGWVRIPLGAIERLAAAAHA